MRSTADQDSRRSSRAPSTRRRWILLIGMVILFVVVFDLLGRLGETDAPRETEAAAESSLEPILPEVVRVGQSGVRLTLEEGGFRLARNLHDEAVADRLVACLEEGIATTPDLAKGGAAQTPGSAGLFTRNDQAHRVWMVTIGIYNRCLAEAGHDPLEGRPRSE